MGQVNNNNKGPTELCAPPHRRRPYPPPPNLFFSAAGQVAPCAGQPAHPHPGRLIGTRIGTWIEVRETGDRPRTPPECHAKQTTGAGWGWVGRPPRSSKGSPTRSPPYPPRPLPPRASGQHTHTHKRTHATLASHLKLPMTQQRRHGMGGATAEEEEQQEQHLLVCLGFLSAPLWGMG